MISASIETVTSPRLPASGKIPIRNIWYMLLYAWNRAEWRRSFSAEIEAAPTLDALLARILAKLVEQRLRVGLGRSYVNERQQLRRLRGRVNFTESLKRLAFQKAQAFCEFQEFSTNAPKNQIVRSTLLRLVEVGQFGIDAGAGPLRDTLRRLQRDLEGVDLIELSPVLIQRQQLGSNDADYALMLNICYLIITRYMPTERRGYEWVPAVDRDSLILHDIYERFVASFYKTHLGGWSVASQQPLTWPAAMPSQFLPQMRADIVLEHRRSGRVVVLDTKFTASSLVGGQFGNVTFDPAHLYQIYAYLRSQEHRSQERAAASGILLYPTVSHALSETIEIQGHRITFQTIDLSMQWQSIHDQLLAIVADQLGANG